MTATLETRFRRAHRRLRTCAVTGTNGKTSTTSFIASMLGAAGPTGKVTTLGAEVDGEPIKGEGTEQFLRFVERAVERGVHAVAIEMTSKALASGLARRWRPHVAVFTNLSHDHLEMHGSAEAYLAAKAQLFMALLPSGTAVLNADEPTSALIDEVIRPDVRRIWYGRGDGERPVDLRYQVQTHGDELLLGVRGLHWRKGATLRVNAEGTFQGPNVAAAMCTASVIGVGSEAIERGLCMDHGLSGRFDVVSREPFVVVDYAHSPDALAKVLKSMRDQTSARLHCVFGCGGDRDRDKRPAMGAVADDLADVVWLTSDNPRSEDPMAIAQAVLPEATRAEWCVELDRAAAIVRAIESARPGDAVLVAGKGHEAIQEGATRVPFDDRAVALAALEGAQLRLQKRGA
ncbi:MAG: UDP-N-acetylmuramoyl-L-alanyl-D-glutamate--2,6-diaminopimelate ligase [Myxococcota bacterium]